MSLPEQHRQTIAERAVAMHYEARPGLARMYDGRKKCVEDALYHLDYLKIAMQAQNPALFADYVDWAGAMLEGRQIPTAHLREHLIHLGAAAEEVLEESTQKWLRDCLETASERLETPPDYPSFLPAEEPFASLGRGYLEALLKGERHRALALIEQAIEEGGG